MPAANPAGGKRLKVLASGLHQLGTACQKLSGELSTDAAAMPSVIRVGWASSLATVNIAAAASGADLAAIGKRIETRGSDYATAGTRYTETDEDGAGEFRRLIG